jgi:RNA polymerase sigma factor (sigma-70 family)
MSKWPDKDAQRDLVEQFKTNPARRIDEALGKLILDVGKAAIGPFRDLSEHERDDVLQDYVAKVLDGGMLKWSGDGAFSTYLFSTARNAAIDATRRQRRRVSVEKDFDGSDFASVASDELLSALLHIDHLLEDCSETERIVIASSLENLKDGGKHTIVLTRVVATANEMARERGNPCEFSWYHVKRILLGLRTRLDALR